jgi:hypothetical protein
VNARLDIRTAFELLHGHPRETCRKMKRRPLNRGFVMLHGQLALRQKTIDRILRKSRVAQNGCWEWAGSTRGSGYGRIFVDRKCERVHRTSYEVFCRPIPDGLVIDHLCRNTKCCNPAHLEPVTNRENLVRGDNPISRNVRKIACPQGHPYTGKNLLIIRGRRVCHICRNKTNLRYRARVRKRLRESRAAS